MSNRSPFLAILTAGPDHNDRVLLSHGAIVDVSPYILNAFLQAQKLEEDLDQWTGTQEWAPEDQADPQALLDLVQDVRQPLEAVAGLTEDLDLVVLSPSLLREMKIYYGLEG